MSHCGLENNNNTKAAQDPKKAFDGVQREVARERRRREEGSKLPDEGVRQLPVVV